MLVLTVSFERKCDFVGFLAVCKTPGISGMSERCVGEKSVVEIYAESDIKEVLATALAEYILGPFRRRTAYEYIDSEYPFVSEDEKTHILKSLTSEDYAVSLKEKIYDYITENNYMDILGFVRFRIPDFYDNVTADAVRVCENFLRRKEYEDMVALLKHHVACSDLSGTADIIFREDGSFGISYSDGEVMDVPSSSGENPDAILGMLMVSIPKTIRIYNRSFAKEGTLSVIETIFGDAVKYSDED